MLATDHHHIPSGPAPSTWANSGNEPRRPPPPPPNSPTGAALGGYTLDGAMDNDLPEGKPKPQPPLPPIPERHSRPEATIDGDYQSSDTGEVTPTPNNPDPPKPQPGPVPSPYPPGMKPPVKPLPYGPLPRPRPEPVIPPGSLAEEVDEGYHSVPSSQDLPNHECIFGEQDLGTPTDGFAKPGWRPRPDPTRPRSSTVCCCQGNLDGPASPGSPGHPKPSRFPRPANPSPRPPTKPLPHSSREYFDGGWIVAEDVGHGHGPGRPGPPRPPWGQPGIPYPREPRK